MEKINIPPFFVGQEVVAVEDHYQKVFKKGDEFKVTSIKKGCCGWNVTIGIFSRNKYGKCRKCKYTYITGKEWIFDSKRFSPKHQYGEFISLKQVAEEAFEMQGVN